MTTTNQLPVLSSVSGGDQIPVWSTRSGDTRRLPVSALVEYVDGAIDLDAGQADFSQSATYPNGTVGAKLKQTVSVKDAPFNAVGDGVTDDTAAINAAIATVGANEALYFPAGNYRVTSTVLFNCAANGVAIIGDGAGATTLTYAGAATNVDCFVFGASGQQRSNWTISGIKFVSSTVMTAGAGVRAYSVNRSSWYDVIFSDQDANGNFFIGAWFNGADMVKVSQFHARGSQEGMRVNGITGLGRADLFLIQGKISNANIGLNVAGNFGGLHVDQVDIINNAVNVRVSQDVVATANRECFFGTGCLIDSASTLKDAATFDGVNVDIVDTNGFIFFDGTWLASCGTCVRVSASFGGILTLNGGIIYNCFNTFGGAGDGIRMAGNATVNINNVSFRNVDGVAVGCDIANTAATVRFANFAGDVVTPLQNIANVVSSNARIASGVDSDPRLTVVGGNSAQVHYASTGTAWHSIALSRSNTAGVQTAASGGFAGVALCGSDGVQFQPAATMLVETDGAVSAGVVPSRLQFSTTTAAGTLTPCWRMRQNGTLEPITDNAVSFGASNQRASQSWVVDAHTFPLASVNPTINGELVVQATSNTSLTFKYRGSDGVTRSASLVLS